MSKHKFLVIIISGVTFGLYFFMKEDFDKREPEKVYIHDIEIQTIEKEVIVEVEKETEIEPDKPDYTFFKTIQLDVDPILQNPELPTGCEVTSLTMILQYYGYDVNKVELSDSYLPKGKIGKTLPYNAFVGNPKDENSFGAYSPVLVTTANLFLSEHNSDLHAKDLTGYTINDLCDYVRDGYPVLVWATIDMCEVHNSKTWIIDGETFTWLANEHCLVLIGFTEDSYIVADPLKGIVEYKKDLFKSRYKEMGKQAVVIE